MIKVGCLRCCNQSRRHSHSSLETESKPHDFSPHAGVLIGFLLSPASGLAETKVYFGNLHAHSQLSDGNSTVTPRMAFQIARQHMDFMSLSEHNHMLTPAEMQTLVAAAA